MRNPNTGDTWEDEKPQEDRHWGAKSLECQRELGGLGSWPLASSKLLSNLSSTKSWLK